MADDKLVSEWLAKADDDYRFASVSLDENNDFYAYICFHFHQAAEKYLKAFIVAYDLEFEKIHDLTRLLKICSVKDSTLASLQEECIILNTSYIETRYPVSWPTDYTKEKAVRAREASRKIGEKIKANLKTLP
jgi:HEPN domain-containing protein